MKQRVSKKFRKGDLVTAIAGNFKGMKGKVILCNGERIIVEGLNVRKRHMKKQGSTPGRIIQREHPIHISNLRACTEEGTPVKLKSRTNKAGDRELVYNDGKHDVVYRAVKKSQT